MPKCADCMYCVYGPQFDCTGVYLKDGDKCIVHGFNFISDPKKELSCEYYILSNKRTNKDAE